MKNSLILLFILSIFSLSQAQFSGEIVYKFEYQTQNNQAITDILEDPKIDSVRYYINEHAYKSVSYSQGEIIEEYVYDPASKKMLFSMGNRPYYLYLQTDLEKFKGKAKLKIKRKEKEKILVYSAYKTVNTSSGEINYYADEITIDASNFSSHYFMQWNEILKQTNGGIPLKTITQHQGYTEIKTAIKIEKLTKKQLDFSFKDNKLQVAAYNNLDEVIAYPELKDEGFWCYQEFINQHSDRLILGKDYLIMLRFIVHADGEISHIEIEESDFEYLNDVAKKIIKSCSLGFEPGSIDGKPVSSEIFYPIHF